MTSVCGTEGREKAFKRAFLRGQHSRLARAAGYSHGKAEVVEIVSRGLARAARRNAALVTMSLQLKLLPGGILGTSSRKYRSTTRYLMYYRLMQKKTVPLFEFPSLAAAWQTDQPMHSQSAKTEHLKTYVTQLTELFFVY